MALYINGEEVFADKTFTGLTRVLDNQRFALGKDADDVLYHRTASLTANTALSNVLEGTPVTPAIAANSLIISNITNDGDILIAASDGGNSKAALFFDASAPDLYLYHVGGAWTGGASTWTIPAFTCGGTVTINGQTFDAGATDLKITTTGTQRGLRLEGSNAIHGPRLFFFHNHTTPEINTIIGTIRYDSYDGNASPAQYRWGALKLRVINATDAAEMGQFEVELSNAGTEDNLAFKVEGNGELYADLDGDSGTYLSNGVNLFDDYIDAEELRRYQLTIKGTGLVTEKQRLANRQRLVELGICEPKENGMMMRVQPMFRLMAGGIWQNRQYAALLEQRIEILENQLRRGN